MLALAVSWCLLLSVPAHATVATLSDGTFANGDWSYAQCYQSAGGQTFQAYQNTTGGNLGDYWFVSETTVNGASENIAQTYLGGSYDPHTQGSIMSLDWSFDAKLITAPGDAGLGAWFILEQGVDNNGHAVIFQSNNIGSEFGDSVITSSNWSTFHEELMSASYWTSNQLVSPGAPRNPDFSTAGGVITFGFEASSDPGSGTNNTYSGGFDNWSVDINHNLDGAPEPMTLALLAVGGLLINRRRSNRAGSLPRRSKLRARMVKQSRQTFFGKLIQTGDMK
jgi:hypothetical protein